MIVAALAVLATQGLCALFAPAWLVTGDLRIGFPVGFVFLFFLFFLRLQTPTSLHQPVAFAQAMPLSLGPAVIFIETQLGQPDAPTRIAIIAGLLTVFAAMLVFAQKLLIRKMQWRLERLNVATEKH